MTSDTSVASCAQSSGPDPFERSSLYYDAIYRYKPYEAEARHAAAWLRGLEPAASADWALLDIGCGTGNFAKHLAPQFRRVVGLDPSANMLEVARRKPEMPPNVAFLHGSFDDLRLLGYHDAAISMFGVMSYATAGDVTLVDRLRQVRAVLRGGGKFVFDVVNLLCCAAGLRGRTLRSFEVGDGFLLRRHMEKTLRTYDSVLDIRIGYELVADDHTVVDQWRERHLMRAFSPREILDAFHAAGFRNFSVSTAPDPNDLREGTTVDVTDYYVWCGGTA